jgi:uncharacterized protein
VSVSAIASIITLVRWRSGSGLRAGITAGVWSGAINTYAGVGGPPLATYFISQKWLHGDFLRTLQVAFIGIDFVSLPILGLPALPWWFYLGGVACIVIGTSTGSQLRRRLSERQATMFSRGVIATAAVVSLVYSVFALLK